MTFEELVSACGSGSVLNGWDAICAVNTSGLNSLLMQQFFAQDLQTRRLVVPISVETGLWILDVELGPPWIAFDSDAGSVAQVAMAMISGSLLNIEPGADGTNIVASVTQLPQDAGFLIGPLSLAGAQGAVSTVGQVVVDLNTNAWQPNLVAIADQVVADQLVQAIQTFFANTSIQYYVGGLGNDPSIPACLTPASFSFAVQQSSDGTDGCVMLLIQTTGSAGQGAPTVYPIPDGSTSSLLIGNDVIFNQLFPPALTSDFQSCATTFSGQNGSGAYQSVATGGSMSLGIIAAPNGFSYDGNNYPSSVVNDENVLPAAVTLPCDGLSMAPSSSGSLSIAWSPGSDGLPEWIQHWGNAWSSFNPGGPNYIHTTVDKLKMEATYSATAAPQVQSNVITFSIPTSQSTAQAKSPPDWWDQKVWGDYNPDGAMASNIATQISTTMATVQLPDVDTFSLVNLWFPMQNAINLSEAAVPCDLVSVGLLETPLAISPTWSMTSTPPWQDVMLAPGGTLQLSATDNSGNPVADAIWEVVPPGLGTIGSNGLYTAPAAVSCPCIDIITVSNQAGTQSSSVAIVITPSTATSSTVLVAPSAASVSAGQTFSFVVTDGSGTPITDATCALSPSLGLISPGLLTGQFEYTAPSSLSGSQTITLTATDGQNATGAAAITLLPDVTIAVTAENGGAVSAGGSITITAEADGLDDAVWVVFPLGSGAIVAASDNALQATYTAPASVTDALSVTVMAYYVGDDFAAFGHVAVTMAAPSATGVTV
jgi:hypothetical protein